MALDRGYVDKVLNVSDSTINQLVAFDASDVVTTTLANMRSFYLQGFISNNDAATSKVVPGSLKATKGRAATRQLLTIDTTSATQFSIVPAVVPNTLVNVVFKFNWVTQEAMGSRNRLTFELERRYPVVLQTSILDNQAGRLAFWQSVQAQINAEKAYLHGKDQPFVNITITGVAGSEVINIEAVSPFFSFTIEFEGADGLASNNVDAYAPVTVNPQFIGRTTGYLVKANYRIPTNFSLDPYAPNRDEVPTSDASLYTSIVFQIRNSHLNLGTILPNEEMANVTSYEILVNEAMPNYVTVVETILRALNGGSDTLAGGVLTLANDTTTTSITTFS